MTRHHRHERRNRRDHERSDTHLTRTVGAAPTSTDAPSLTVVAVLALAPMALAFAASYPTVAAVAVAALVGARLQRRYDARRREADASATRREGTRTTRAT